MHEKIFVDRIVSKAESQGKVKGIVVEVGELAQIEACHLEEALNARKKWKVEVRRKGARVRCACGHEGEPRIMDRGHDFVLYKCQKCDDIPHVLDGDMVKLVQVEVE